MTNEHLQQLTLIRERCLAVAASELQFWTTNEALLPQVADFILTLIQRDYGTDYASIRPHGRWSHFLAQGVDRISPLLDSWKDLDAVERTRRMIDLTLVSVVSPLQAQGDGLTLFGSYWMPALGRNGATPSLAQVHSP
jgi:hypothetical protein